MDQPVPKVAATDVARVIDRDFAPSDRKKVKSLLAQYRDGDGSVPAPRVHLAILKLSAGDVDQVSRFVQDARSDFRDVLAWAEYSRHFALDDDEDEAVEQKAIRDDWAEYKHWLARK